jgi:predicted RND superfamily exporter protein
MMERFYLRLYDRLFRRPRRVLLLLGLVVAGALPGLLHLRLDMSFRPLFADEAAEAAATREFAQVFGQPSGAFVGVVIEPREGIGAPFLGELSRLSREVERIEHVAEVVNLARLAVPAGSGAGARGVWALPPELLERGPAPRLEARLEGLRADPRVRRVLLSEDGRKTLLLARLDLPLEDLEGRSRVIRELRSRVSSRLPGAELHFVGVSVVEDEYARIVLRSLARSLGLTVLALVGVLWLVFRRAAPVAVALAGVSAATPVALAVMVLRGQALTMVNSMVPTMILILGVADAIHMQQAYMERARRGMERARAVREMFGEMALPCLLTALTTALGFASLATARITALRDFGANVALGVAVVYVMNLLLVPVLLRVLPEGRLLPASSRAWDDAWIRLSSEVVRRRPGRLVAGFALATLAVIAAVPQLRVDQRFNEEVAPGHPVRVGQVLLEREFSGFLGPEVSLRRTDGGSVLDAGSLGRLRAYRESVLRLPGVQRVESVLDYLPADASAEEARATMESLRADPLLRRRVRELVDAEIRRAALLVRTEDVGTRRAMELGRALEEAAQRQLGAGFEARVVGEWWLAQRGMDNILRDMLVSFATSCLLVLPLMALALRRPRLIVLSILPNVLPMVFALGFMAWAGITLRIGTAMILAIALGIAVDDTTHMLVRLKEEMARTPSPEAAIRAALRRTGRAMLYSTVVLVLGFLSMLSNDLIAIRDMGLVAAVTLSVAFLLDVYLAPALFLLISRRRAPALALRPAFGRRGLAATQ